MDSDLKKKTEYHAKKDDKNKRNGKEVKKDKGE